SVLFSLVVQLKIRLKLDLLDFLRRLVEQVSPPHLLRDDLITIRVIDVFLEQFHIAFCLAILLLEKSFPIVFIPSTLWLIVEISHTPFLYLRLPEPAKFLSRIVWRRSWPQAASMSLPFSRLIVASTPL